MLDDAAVVGVFRPVPNVDGRIPGVIIVVVTKLFIGVPLLIVVCCGCCCCCGLDP